MIGTRTPFRISFVGGGSDMKDFYKYHDGAVLSTSIDKYVYIFIHSYFENKIQVKYSKTELVDKIKNIEHPIVRELLNQFKQTGIDINSIADIPSGTGLGSSSSFAVGLIHALYAYTNKLVSSSRLAKDASELEINILKEPIGKQDQFAAAYGGFNIIRFSKNENVDIQPIIAEQSTIKELQENLIMFYLGKRRKASQILKDQKKNIIDDSEKIKTLYSMTKLVDELAMSITNADLKQFGEILNENWELKRSLSKKITNDDIDECYKLGLNNGAIGGKLLGAGGGGFMLFYCPKKNHSRLRKTFYKLKELNFRFERTGSKIIYIADNDKRIWKKNER